MPRSANTALRASLIDVAARLLSTEGPAALTTRRLATEVGTSTMGIYTHFGSMADLHAAVRRAGFARFTTALGDLPQTEDAVTRLAAAVFRYLTVATAEPESYRAMFDVLPPGQQTSSAAIAHDDGVELFDLLSGLVGDCLDAGRLRDLDRSSAAAATGELWAATHGLATLTIAGLLPAGATDAMRTDLVIRLLIGFGERPDDARRCVTAAAEIT